MSARPSPPASPAPARSEVEAAVQLPPALLPGPRAALEAELAQVLLEVLVVHGAVVLGFTVRLQGRGGHARVRDMRTRACALLRPH